MLAPTHLYVKSALAAIATGGVSGLAHITGGGITDNLPRALPDGLDAEIDLGSWTPPGVFGWLSRAAGIAEREMLRTFNCGLGLIAVLRPGTDDAAIAAFASHGQQACVIGRLVEGKGEAQGRLQGQARAVTARKRTAVLISGRGTNLEALIAAAATSGYPAEIALVISNIAGVEGLARAEKSGIATRTIPHRNYKSREAFDDAVHAALTENAIDLVCLAGFMRILVRRFRAEMGGPDAQHPSLASAGLQGTACPSPGTGSRRADFRLHRAFRGACTRFRSGDRAGRHSGPAGRRPKIRLPRARSKPSTASIRWR